MNIITEKDIVINYLEEIFSIIYENMLHQNRAGNKDSDYLIWSANFKTNLKNPQVNFILVFDKQELSSYIEYLIDENIVNLDEIQIKLKYQGDKKTFPLLISSFLNSELVKNKTELTCYVNKSNNKALSIYQNIGLKIISETKNGYKLQGKISDAQTWCKNKNYYL